MTEPIHRQLRTIRRAMQLHQKDLATILGVHTSSIVNWDTGRQDPNIHHAHAYAQALHHPLTATNNGNPIGALIDVVPTLPALRYHLGITQTDMGHLTGAGEHAVQGLERRIRAGRSPRLSSVEWYLPGFGYQIELVPARALERAA